VDEARKVLATFDPIAALAATNVEKLDALLREVNTGEAAVQNLLTDLSRSNGLYHDETLPALDDLADEHGEPDPEEFWPVIKIKVSPETREHFEAPDETVRGHRGCKV
jgi:hypothetical protein